MSKPFVIGLTGSIGCGKSCALRTLVSFGAEGLDADQIAHEVMAPGGAAHATVVGHFGVNILTADGQIDRKRLGEQVFSDPAALRALESIVHPAVDEALRRRLQSATAPVVVIEAIKLFEAGLDQSLCDEVWVTACHPEQQVERLAASRGMTADEVRKRRDAQMSPAEMIARADRTIDTGGSKSDTGLRLLQAWVGIGAAFPPARVRAGSVEDAEGIAAVLNAIIREGGLTVLDRTVTPDEERAFLQRLPARARVTVVEVGCVLSGFQVVEPYAGYTGAMDHVASLGTWIAAPARGRGYGEAMARATLACAHASGFTKLVISVREDNPGAQAFYSKLGFQPCGRLRHQALIDGHYVDELLYERFLEPGVGSCVEEEVDESFPSPME